MNSLILFKHAIPIIEKNIIINGNQINKLNTSFSFINTVKNKEEKYIIPNSLYYCIFYLGTPETNLSYYKNDINNTNLFYFINFENVDDEKIDTKVENTIFIFKNMLNNKNFKVEKIINNEVNNIIILKENISPIYNLGKYKYEFVITNCLNESDNNCINIIYHTFYLNNKTYTLYKKYLKQMKYLKYKLKYLLLKKISN